jgi:hypothetical protein
MFPLSSHPQYRHLFSGQKCLLVSISCFRPRSRSILGGGSRFTSCSRLSASAAHCSHTGFRVNPSNGFLGFFFSLDPFRCFVCFLFLCRPQPTSIRMCKNQICHTNTTPKLIRITRCTVIRPPPMISNDFTSSSLSGQLSASRWVTTPAAPVRRSPSDPDCDLARCAAPLSATPSPPTAAPVAPGRTC